ncbi:helix-turn-helix transcriptional regulator [Sphingomonas sp. PB4P5]|uniref:helix-turn-helix transcriptional regulator n=1 Tax=Parasphingomonas puruogangriensis TaxID=3096155 RepID=UPI002FC7A295
MAIDSCDRIIRLKEVLQKTGLSRSTLYRKVALRTFPKQIAISTRCAGWRESDLNEWLRNPMAYEQPANTPPA